jgi:hypothetical protein
VKPVVEPLPKRTTATAPKMHVAFGARLTESTPAERVTEARPTVKVERQPTEEKNAPPESAPRPRAVEEVAAVETPEPMASRTVEASVAPERPADGPETPEAPRPAARPAPTAEPPKPAPVARDIRLEVNGADRKVEVRLVERAGEVQFAVRTPDSRLAGELREHLPTLAARLEESGFHADQWRAAEAVGGERRLDVRASSEAAGQTPEHRGGQNGREQRDEQPRRTAPEEQNRSQKKGSAFEWLMQSLG